MKKTGISRRKFLSLSALGLTAAALAPEAEAVAAMMGGGGGGMGGGTTIINPPPGAAFRDPATAVNTSTTPGIVEVALDMREATVNVGGANARLMTYNGLFPGPTIRVNKRDTLRLHLKNSLPPTTEAQVNLLGHRRNITNLHTHGLHVSPKEPADYMGVMLSPVGSDDGMMHEYPYEYDLMYEEAGHLNLYHPHVHGTVAEQYWAGLMGALVVEDETPVLETPSSPPYETHIMVLKDMTISNGLPTAYTSMMDYMHGKEGTAVMVNGQVNPVLNIKPGQVQRWRFVNGCNARFFNLSLEGHSMYLVGTDSGLLDRPHQVFSLLLSPGERADLLVKADKTAKSYRLLSLPYSRGGNSPLQQVTLLTMAYKGSRMDQGLPVVVNPLANRLPVDMSMPPMRTMTLSMMQGRGYINGLTFRDMDNCYKIMSMVGDYEVWEIINQSGMDHPFHQHVNAAQVLSITGGDAGYASLYTSLPAWKDVVIIPKWGSARLLVPVMHWEGMAMFHCHIIEHEDIGMMGMWHLMPEGEEMPM